MRRIAALVVTIAAVLGLASPAGSYQHLGASNNVSLSVQWSQALFGPTADRTAIIVRSDSFADSLAAGALAGALGAPVLMTPPGQGLAPGVQNELGRLMGNQGTVRVIGGTAAVSDQVVSDLEGLGYDAVRIAGANRVATAGAVMNAAADASVYGGATVAYLARAFGDGSAAFADSLGAGMLAGTQAAPLLTSETAALSADTRSAIDAMGTITSVVIIGGTAAVSQAVADQLAGMGISVSRIAGATRFATAAMVAERSFDDAGEAVIALVDGVNVNSWASGYAASAASGGAVVLSNGAALPSETAAFLDSSGVDTDNLYCAPEVDHTACTAADDHLNG